MKKRHFFMSVSRSLFAVALTATAALGTAFTAASCSSDNEDEVTETEITEEGIEFPIYANAVQGPKTSEDEENDTEETRAKAARALGITAKQASSMSALPWMPAAVEEILPEGFNPVAAESEAAEREAAEEAEAGSTSANPNRTQYRYDANRNFLSVMWKSGDAIGIKTAENATSGSGTWTSLTLTSGIGSRTGQFEGVANTTSGLQPTGVQNVTGVYPFSADGSYNISSQLGTLNELGRYDIRVDNGELRNAYVRDIYFVTKICVFRIHKEFFDQGDDTKTKGSAQATITVRGLGIGNQLTGICSSSESVTAGAITATVNLDRYSGKPLEDVYMAFIPIDTDEAEFSIEVECSGKPETYSRYVFYKSHFVTGTMYNLRHPSDDMSEQCIDFVDDEVEAILVQNFDQDKNNCISWREVRSVTYLGTIFANTGIHRFPEFQYFTNHHPEVTNNMFNNCVNLTDIVLPMHVTTIGEAAFSSTRSLTSINLQNITEVKDNAFKNCDAMTEADLPNAIRIGSSAFYDCDALQTAEFPVATTIGSSAFQNCDVLTDLNFPVATTIGSSAFYDCDALQTAEFPVATTIGSSAFQNCDVLTDLNFPVATTVGTYAFYLCKNLTTEIELPAATRIEEGAFAECQRLHSIYVPEAVYIGFAAFKYCTLREVDLPKVETIEGSAFSDNKNLSRVNAPKCTSIGVYAFLEVYNLQNLTVAKGCVMPPKRECYPYSDPQITYVE